MRPKPTTSTLRPPSSMVLDWPRTRHSPRRTAADTGTTTGRRLGRIGASGPRQRRRSRTGRRGRARGPGRCPGIGGGPEPRRLPPRPRSARRGPCRFRSRRGQELRPAGTAASRQCVPRIPQAAPCWLQAGRRGGRAPLGRWTAVPARPANPGRPGAPARWRSRSFIFTITLTAPTTCLRPPGFCL